MESLICPNCGAENEPTAKRCKECNALLVGLHKENKPSTDDLKGKDINFLANNDQDLPGLLHALKQDGDITTDGGGVAGEGEGYASREDEAFGDRDLSMDEEGIPEWLQRIRKRAKKETDAAGEITQKLSVTQENLAEDKLETHDRSFASWIESLRGEGSENEQELETTSEKTHGDDAETAQKDPGWLSKIRKVKGISPGEYRKGSYQKTGDSLLQWLVALEEGREPIQPIPGENAGESVETESDEKVVTDTDSPEGVDLTQKITMDGKSTRADLTPQLDVSREEQAHADLFSSTVLDEKSSRAPQQIKTKSTNWVIRLMTSFLFLTVLSLTLFTGWFPELETGNLQPPGWFALIDSIENFPEDGELLLIADYQAGFAEEIELVALPILSEAIRPGMALSVVSSKPAGFILIRQLLTAVPNSENLIINDLGYVPSPGFAAYDIVNIKQVGPGVSNLINSTLPVSDMDLDGAFILTDSYEGGRLWIEQLSARLPQVPLYLLVTAQVSPMLLPYQESGQVVGVAAGIADSLVMDSLGNELEMPRLWRAYQAGILMLIAAILVGAIFSLNSFRVKKMDGADELE